MLFEEMAAAVVAHRPRSVAVIGCAGGNGFDLLTSPGLERVVGIDINPAFIEVTRARYHEAIKGLELHVADIAADLAGVVPVDLIFAGLVLEYVEIGRAMGSLRTLCREGGAMVVVLQQPGAGVPPVSPSPYQSLRSLGGSMQLLDPRLVTRCAESAGFQCLGQRNRVLPSGKEFAVVSFRS